MTKEEIEVLQAFYKTPIGAALRRYENAIVRETQYGERDDPWMKKLRELNDETLKCRDVLRYEITILQKKVEIYEKNILDRAMLEVPCLTIPSSKP